MKSESVRKIIYASAAWLLVVFWLVFIYSMSADDGETSSNKSNAVTEFVAETVVPNYENMTQAEKNETVNKMSLPIRKLAHFTEYFVLGVLSTMATLLTPKVSFVWLRLGIPFVLSVGYAAFDEFHQSFVPGRGPAFTDVCIDGSGAVLGIAFVFGVLALKNYKCARKKSAKTQNLKTGLD